MCDGKVVCHKKEVSLFVHREVLCGDRRRKFCSLLSLGNRTGRSELLMPEVSVPERCVPYDHK